MARKLIIFGNGLGRALSNEYFQLKSAMASVWSDQDVLSDDEKKLIATSIQGVEPDEGPTSEDELEGTQLALIAINLLRSATNDDDLKHWISKGAQDFPAVLARYTFQVAKYFHNYPTDLLEQDRWTGFVKHLVSFIYKSKSHVATLNYDSLLYAPFNEIQMVDGESIKLCDGYNGTLLDGYTSSTGFSAGNMRRFSKSEKSFYMHLHGSPLFVEEGQNKVTKLTRWNLPKENGARRSHVVLTSGSFKPMVISESKVLRMYWEHLLIAIEEAVEIILFGYSGGDSHLNSIIRERRDGRPVRVIERSHNDDRTSYWEEFLGPDVSVLSYDNILDFNRW